MTMSIGSRLPVLTQNAHTRTLISNSAVSFSGHAVKERQGSGNLGTILTFAVAALGLYAARRKDLAHAQEKQVHLRRPGGLWDQLSLADLRAAHQAELEEPAYRVFQIGSQNKIANN